MAESTTTENCEQGHIYTEWVTATHASRAADMVIGAYYTTSFREGLRIRASIASGAAIGFFGVTPASRAGTTDDIKDALTNYGLLNGTSATPLNLDCGKLTCAEAEIDGNLNHDGSNVGFYGTTPAAQHSTTGETTGFTGGAGTAARVDSTFTGNVGSTAYTISDVVKALKNIGLMTS
jgi:hypothetical protein